MLTIAGVHVKAGVLTRDLVSHGTFKNTTVDKRHGKCRGSVIGAGLWSASLGLSLQPKRPRVLLFGMVPAGLKPSTGLLGLVRHLGVVSWSKG